jgi:hypothetical protein
MHLFVFVTQGSQFKFSWHQLSAWSTDLSLSSQDHTWRPSEFFLQTLNDSFYSLMKRRLTSVSARSLIQTRLCQILWLNRLSNAYSLLKCPDETWSNDLWLTLPDRPQVWAFYTFCVELRLGQWREYWHFIEYDCCLLPARFCDEIISMEL